MERVENPGTFFLGMNTSSVELENTLREVALGRVRNDGRNLLPCAQSFRDPDGGENVCPRARSREHPFEFGELFYHVEGIAIGHCNDLVGDEPSNVLGMKLAPMPSTS